MVKTRIHDDQVVDEDFLSEFEFNSFFGEVVITGTTGRDDTELTTSFSVIHDAVDNLVHTLAETQDTEIIRSGGKVIGVDIKTLGGTLIRSTTITRSGGKVTQVIENQHDAAGTIIQTITSTINRAGGKVTSVSVVET